MARGTGSSYPTGTNTTSQQMWGMGDTQQIFGRGGTYQSQSHDAPGAPTGSPAAKLGPGGTQPLPLVFTGPTILGMPEWLFWTLLSVLIVVVITVVALLMTRGKRAKAA